MTTKEINMSIRKEHVKKKENELVNCQTGIKYTY